MEEALLPTVPFGKYKNKSVLELISDKQYVEWLKQQSWFPNQKQIYNIVVNQTISTTNNSKTPEHNKLQNLFLDKSNQKKLLSNLFKSRLDLIELDGILNLFKDADFIRCFGKNTMPVFINDVSKTTVKFEEKYNWDLIMYYEDHQIKCIISIQEIELIDKLKYKEQYDVEEKEKYTNNLLLMDKLILSAIANNIDYDIFKKCQDIRYISIDITEKGDNRVNRFKKYKKEYEDVYSQNYETKFNEHYNKYRLQYYRDIVEKYCGKNRRRYIDVINTINNEYELIIDICHYEDRLVFCELKPTLSDDYPCVLRKMKAQIELTRKDGTFGADYKHRYILLIGTFTSVNVSKEQLITIFNQSNIKVMFTDELFETSSTLTSNCINTHTQHLSCENKLIEENKLLTDNLLQTQQKLLQSEERIKQLEEDIQLLKSQKQNKSIKDYFGKK
jgi:hypothetical protein